MTQLPTTLGQRAMPTPQRAVRGYSVPSGNISYDTSPLFRSQQSMARAVEGLGRSVSDAADHLQAKADRDAVLDAQRRENEARREAMDFLYGAGDDAGLYSQEGMNAIGSEQRFEKRWKEIREKTFDGVENPVALRALEKSMDTLELSHLDNVKRFEAGKRKAYASYLTAESGAVANDRVGLEFNNEDTFQTALLEVTGSARAKAKIDGLPAEQAIRAARSGLYKTRFTAMLNSDNPAVVGQAYQKYMEAQQKGEMVFSDVNALDSAFDSVKPKIEASTAFDEFRGGNNLDTAKTDDVFNAMIQVESGGQHYDDDGNVKESHAGALGIAQVMPDTAKMMAKELGLKGDSWLDPGVNRAIGEAYFKKMQDQFENNTLAVLAYNWGPGNVNKHIDRVGDPRAGEVSMDYFMATVTSDEARKYVPKVMAASGGGIGRLDTSSAAAFSTKLEPKARAEFMKLVDNQNEAQDAISDAAAKDAMNDSLAFMQANGGGWESLPNMIRAKADMAGVTKDLMEYTGKTDPETATFLYSLDAKTLKGMDLNTPGIRLKLSPADYDMWVKKQESLDNAAVMVTHEVRNRMVNATASKLNIKTKTDAGKAKMQRLNELLDVEIQAFAEHNGGRYPNQADMQKIIDSLFTEHDMTPGTPWNPFNWGGTKYPHDVTIDQISEKDQSSIKALLESRGIPATEAMIIETYISGSR